MAPSLIYQQVKKLKQLSYFGATGTPVLVSGDVSSGFQSQNGFCLIRIVEANVMYMMKLKLCTFPALHTHVGKQLATMLVVKRLAGVAPQVDLRECALHLSLQKRIRKNPLWL